MASINYAIYEDLQVGAGLKRFLFHRCEEHYRISAPMSAVLDYNKEGILFRIEITFLLDKLAEVGKSLEANELTAETKIVLQVGQDNPVSLILWVDSLYDKSASHSVANAWLLEDENGQVAGLEIVQPQ
ncbi:hypothetical protein [Hoeflea sp. TYP-13]|uniref:hypothetical protein n=1 Tax=Hoeflea sp. TYP-13 TaxID=3230023 RepID=UPI0034C63B9E